jgi:hypothetical protein
MASHTAEELRAAAKSLAQAARAAGLDPSRIGSPPSSKPRLARVA